MRTLVFSVLLILAFCDVSASDRLAGFVARAESMELADHPVWLRLLHYENGDSSAQSEILDDEFFLAANGRYSAYDELVATLEAFVEERSAEPNESILCRFPARYHFLDATLGINLPAAECPRLESWSKFEQLDSVSLMMISGYFGNPASTFGHILLKINNGSVPDGYTLLDLGVNFGAVVPENEPTVIYVLRGLFGGYQAGFSDQDYYLSDLTYTRTEFRDMWEYKLGLSEYQQKLLLYHLWEITGRRFQYFFLKGNCAFRIAELLELVTGESFVDDVDFWYAPISVFHRLEQVDSIPNDGDDLIATIRYRQSAQRVFYAQVGELDSEERASLNRLIDSGGDLDELQDASPQRKTRVLDTLLEYYQYRMAGMLDEDTDASLRRAKDDAIRARLALPPAGSKSSVQLPERRAPSSAAPPSKIGVGAGHNSQLGAYTFATFAGFSYETIGNNLLDHSSLTMVDLAVAFDSDSVWLEALDIVRARKVNLNSASIPGESTSSWEVALGARREQNNCRSCSEAFAEGSIGKSARLGDTAAVSALVGADIATGSAGSSAFTRLALNFGSAERWGHEVGATYKYYPRDEVDRLILRWTSRVSIAQRHEIYLDLSDDDELDSRLYYAYRW